MSTYIVPQDDSAVNGQNDTPSRGESFGQKIQNEAVRGFNLGWDLLPLKPGSKEPLDTGWRDKKLESLHTVVETFPIGGHFNLGVKTGKASGGLVVVDLDHIDPVIAAMVLDSTGLRDGRPSRQNSHWFYVVGDNEGRFRKITCASPALGGATAIEVLGDGQQAVLPPSYVVDKHGVAESRAWVVNGKPEKVTAAELTKAVYQAAALNELAVLWEKSDQHHIPALPLVGFLLRAGVGSNTVEQFLEYIWPSADRNEIKNAVEGTVRKMESDEPFTGFRALRKEWPGFDASFRRIRQWLEPDSPFADDLRPRVQISAEIGKFTDDVWEAIEEANEPPTVFQRAGELSRATMIKVGKDSEGRDIVLPGLQRHTVDSLRTYLSRSILFVKATKQGEPAKASPTKDLCSSLLSDSPENMTVPVVTRVVSHPIFGADGSLRLEAGYHEASQTYLWISPGTKFRPVSQKPTPDEVKEAKRLLFDEFMVDFKFVNDASRAHALAFGLLPYGLPLINGQTPGHMFEAPKRGNGKDRLPQSIGKVWNGEKGISSMAYMPEDEMRKTLVALVRQGAPYCYIANIKGGYGGESLEHAITEGRISGRVLGLSEMHTGDMQFIWIFTGNNARPLGDMSRRIITIRLDAGVPDPWNRKDFKHQLPSWALENRVDLTWAYLTLWANWLAKGRPRGERSLGSFESWSEVMGGVLDAADVPGFLGNFDEFQTMAEEHDGWPELLELWALGHGTELVKPSQLVRIAQVVEGMNLFENTKSDQGRAQAMSEALRSHRDATWSMGEGADGVMVRIEPKTDNRTHATRYRLQFADGRTLKGDPGALHKRLEVLDAELSSRSSFGT